MQTAMQKYIRKYPKRLTVEVDEDLSARFNKVIPHGVRGMVIQVIMADICELVEKEPRALGLIISKQLKTTEKIKHEHPGP